MSVRRHEQQTRTSDSGHGVLAVWLPFCGAGSFETYGGGILVVVEGDAAIPGVSGPQCGVSGWLPTLLLAEAGRRRGGAYHRAEAFEGGVQPSGAVIFLPVFGQPVATRRRTRLEGILAVLGEIRGGGPGSPVWDVDSGGTVCVLVADCQRPQSRARLKP